MLFNCERYFNKIINVRLYEEFIVPWFDGKTYDQYLIILMVRSLANNKKQRLLFLRERALLEEANNKKQKEDRQEKQMANLALSAREQIQQQMGKDL